MKDLRNLIKYAILIIVVSLVVVFDAHAASITVTDDTGKSITLPQPAQSIVSLAPNITELLFDVGAGAKVVGAVEFSNYPDAAKHIPRIGRNNALDIERILSLKPDLVIAWDSGNPRQQIEKLQKLGLHVFRSEPRHLKEIADSLRRFGQLAGTQAQADAAAQKFMQRFHQLQQKYAQRSEISVFYQIWDQPLMTLNGKHMVSQVIELCGGDNVFASLPVLSPTVSTEAVITANPHVIIAATTDKTQSTALRHWRQWTQLPAVQNDNLFVINSDIIQRNTPRILDGMQRLCEILDEAREHERDNED